VVYPPTGSTAYEREMSTPPTLLRSMALLYLYLLLDHCIISIVILLIIIIDVRQ